MTVRLLDPSEMEQTLRSAWTIVVLGIKPESRRTLDAHQIPLYLQKVGYEIIPIPIRYPDVSEILGARVVRRLADVRVPIDVLSVFVKPEDLPSHLDEILAARPGVVWFQSGLLRSDFAEAIARAGVPIAEDCIGCRRASMAPSWEPLPAQRRAQ